MIRDKIGELDGKPARMGDVPKDRLADWSTMVDGKPVRPFRFVDVGGGALVVKK